MSAQAPLASVMETSSVSLLEPSFEQPKLPATTSVIMTALKPIDINPLLQKFLFTNSPKHSRKQLARNSIRNWQSVTLDFGFSANPSYHSLAHRRRISRSES